MLVATLMYVLDALRSYYSYYLYAFLYLLISQYLRIYVGLCIAAADKTSTAAVVAMRLISFAALAAWQPQFQLQGSSLHEKKSGQPPIVSA